jgi:hypothetical protein
MSWTRDAYIIFIGTSLKTEMVTGDYQDEPQANRCENGILTYSKSCLTQGLAVLLSELS